MINVINDTTENTNKSRFNDLSDFDDFVTMRKEMEQNINKFLFMKQAAQRIFKNRSEDKINKDDLIQNKSSEATKIKIHSRNESTSNMDKKIVVESNEHDAEQNKYDSKEEIKKSKNLYYFSFNKEQESFKSNQSKGNNSEPIEEPIVITVESKKEENVELIAEKVKEEEIQEVKHSKTSFIYLMKIIKKIIFTNLINSLDEISLLEEYLNKKAITLFQMNIFYHLRQNIREKKYYRQERKDDQQKAQAIKIFIINNTRKVFFRNAQNKKIKYALLNKTKLLFYNKIFDYIKEDANNTKLDGYYQYKIKSKSFNSIKLLLKSNRELNKKISFIKVYLIYKYYFRFLKIQPIKVKNNTYNKRIVEEFRLYNRKRQGFNLIKLFSYQRTKERKEKYNTLMNKTKTNKGGYINIQISKTELILQNDQKINNIAYNCKRIVKNNIKIVK